MERRALDGIEVLDLGQVYHGPYASLLLAYLGADVIKIEPPFGEQLRERVEPGEEPAELVMLNASKQGITLNLKEERGVELFLELVRETDVVIENFSTGTMDRLGLGYDRLAEVNPELIYAHGSGFGESGPYKDYPAMDLTIQAISGVMAVTGYEDQPPVKTGVAIGDFLGGVHLAAGVLAALFQRERTGEGQFVEESMHDAIFPTLTSAIAAHFNDVDAPERTGNRHSGLARCPYNVYRAADGHVALYCSSNEHWRSLLGVLGREDLLGDPRYATNVERIRRLDEVDEMVEAWTRERSRDELAESLLAAGVPAAPVKGVEEVIYDPHLEARGMSVPMDHPAYGEIRVPGTPIRLSASAAPDVEPAPTKGRDTRSVLADRLGVSEEELDRLADDDVI